MHSLVLVSAAALYRLVELSSFSIRRKGHNTNGRVGCPLSSYYSLPLIRHSSAVVWQVVVPVPSRRTTPFCTLSLDLDFSFHIDIFSPMCHSNRQRLALDIRVTRTKKWALLQRLVRFCRLLSASKIDMLVQQGARRDGVPQSGRMVGQSGDIYRLEWRVFPNQFIWLMMTMVGARGCVDNSFQKRRAFPVIDK